MRLNSTVDSKSMIFNSFNGSFPFTTGFGLRVLLSVTVLSCSNETNPISPIADINVREQVNLNTAEALPLKARDGNFIYIKGGYKGIIVYRKSQDSYFAFERKSPYLQMDTCGVITAHSSQLYMEDQCHGCSFNWEGRPIAGPCRDIMKAYNVQFLNTFTLLITNP